MPTVKWFPASPKSRAQATNWEYVVAKSTR